VDTTSQQDELEVAFVNDRVALGALQNEIDVYFGPNGPGQSLHRLADLVMVRFMQVTNAPESQQLELQARLLAQATRIYRSAC
jgi:hypothetical protein